MPIANRLRCEARSHAGRSGQTEEEVTVHAWLNELEWLWLGFFMAPWILLIAALGYAAAHISLRQPDKRA
jgi:hypothetical protein